jgi:hypothetical protein
MKGDISNRTRPVMASVRIGSQTSEPPFDNVLQVIASDDTSAGFATTELRGPARPFRGLVGGQKQPRIQPRYSLSHA